MGKKYETSIRYSTQDHKKIVAAMKELGTSGKDALELIEKSAKPAKKGLTNLDKASREVQHSMRNMAAQSGVVGRSFASMGKAGLIAGAAFAAIGLAGREAVGVIAEFEVNMSGVRAVTSATTEDMARMEAQARLLGEATRFSAAEAAAGMQFLGQAGFEVNEILASMPALLDLATAGQLDLATASDLTSNIMGGFGLTAEKTTRVTDIMAVTAASANTNILQLGEAFSKVAPVAASFGDSIDETAALLGVLGNSGLQAEVAGTGLKQAYIKLAAPTAAVNRILKELGLTHKDVNPATQSLTSVIKKLTAANISGAQATELFGARAVTVFSTISSHLGDLDALTEKINASAGAAKEMATIMDDNLSGAWLRFKSALSETALELNDGGLGASLTGLTDAGTASIKVLNSALDKLSYLLRGTRVSFNLLTLDIDEARALSTKWRADIAAENEAIQQQTRALYDAKAARLGYATAIEFRNSDGSKVKNDAEIKAEKELEARKESLTRAVMDNVDAMYEELRVSKLSREEQVAHAAVAKAQEIAKKKELQLTERQITAIRLSAKETFRAKEEHKSYLTELKAQEKAKISLNKTIDEQVRGMREELQLLQLTGQERTVQKALMDAENTARKANIELTKEQRNAIEDASRALGNEKQALEDAHATAGLFGDAAEDFGNRLVDSIRSGEPALDSLKDFALDTFAEIARAAIIKTVINPVFSAAGGAMFGDQTGDAIQQQLGGGGGFDVSSLSNLTSMFGGGSTFAGGFGAVNQFGANYLGTGLPGMAGGATSTGLSGILGGGMLGGMGASMLGLGSGNALLDTGASALGSYAATIALTPILGPLAPIVGGFVGTAIAGTFGGDPSSDIAEFKSTVGDGGKLTNTSYGSKNISTERAEEQSAFLQGFLQSLTQGFGLEVAGGEVFGGYHSEKGNFLRTNYNHGVDEKEFYFDPEDQKSVNDALFGLAFELTKVESGTEGVSAETQKLIDAYAALDAAGEDTTEVLRQLAIDTGIAGKNFNEGLSEQLKQLLDPRGYSVDMITKEFDALRDSAIELGGDLSLVNELEEIRLEQFRTGTDLVLGSINAMESGANSLFDSSEKLAQSFGSVANKLLAARQDIQFGNTTVLSNEDQYLAIKSLFEETRSAADSGDISAMEALPEVSNKFLELSQSFNMSAMTFKDDYAAVDKALKDAIAVAETQEDMQLKTSQDMLDVLRDIRLGILSSPSDIAALMVSDNILRDGETAGSLVGKINTKSQIDVITDRNLKAAQGFDFSGNQKFAEWVNDGHQDEGQAYLAALQAAGGRVTKFAQGGVVSGGRAGVDSVPALLQAGEVVLSNRDVEKVIGGNGAVVEAVQNLTKTVTDMLGALLETNDDMLNTLQEVAG